MMHAPLQNSRELMLRWTDRRDPRNRTCPTVCARRRHDQNLRNLLARLPVREHTVRPIDHILNTSENQPARKWLKSGAPGEIRTPDLLLRRQSLYPTELRAHTNSFSLHGWAEKHQRQPSVTEKVPRKCNRRSPMPAARTRLLQSPPVPSSYAQKFKRGAAQ